MNYGRLSIFTMATAPALQPYTAIPASNSLATQRPSEEEGGNQPQYTTTGNPHLATQRWRGACVVG